MRRSGAGVLAGVALLAVTASVGSAAPDDPVTEPSEPTTAVAPEPAPTPSAAEADAQAGPVGYTIIFSDGCKLATVGLTDGVVTAVGASFDSLSCVADLTFGNDGSLYGIIGGAEPLRAHLVRFDLTTGAPTDLGPITGSFTTTQTFGTGDVGIATGNSGRILVTMGTDETPACGPVLCVYDVDPATLVGTLVGPLGAPAGPFDDKPTLTLTADCGTTAWTVVSRSETVQELFLTTVSQTNGTADDGPVIGFTSGANPHGIELARSTRILYLLASDVQSAEALYALDPGSGATTPIAPISGDNDSATIERLAIPGSCPVAIAAEPTFTG
jgi:hypothetical protein